jgi:transcriptional regulator with XRE-family HTH domain
MGKDLKKIIHKAPRDVRSSTKVKRRFGRMIKREIIQAGLTPSACAHLLGYGVVSFFQVLSGVKPIPPLYRLEQWAIVLDIDRDVLLCWADMVDPEVIRILAKHPVLCKKIREMGEELLTPEEQKLNRDLYDGRRRSFR